MGIFDIFKSKKTIKNKWVNIYSPIAGKIIPLSEVPDDAFAQKMLGDGCAIEAFESSIFSPVDGEVSIFELNTVMSFGTKDGLEILFHLGIGNISSTSYHYQVLNLSESDKLVLNSIKKVIEDGFYPRKTKLVEYNYKIIKENYLSMKSPLIIMNMDMVEKIEIVESGEVKAGDLIMRVLLK